MTKKPRSTRVTFMPPVGLVARRLDAGRERFVVFEWMGTRDVDSTTLTPAERAILSALLRGLSNAEIARTRGTSRNTIVNQVGSIFRKLGVRSRSELQALGARSSDT